MKLMKKDTSIRVLVLATLAIAFFLVLIVSLWYNASSQQQRIESFAEHQLESMTNTYFDGLNTMMLTGSIAKREVLRDKLRAEPHVLEARVIRGPLINKLYGNGFPGEQAVDALDRRGLGGEFFTRISQGEQGRVMTMVKPIIAQNNDNGLNCHSCHQSSEGDVLGAIRIEYSLEQIDSEMWASLTTSSLIQVLLFVIAFVVTAWVLNHQVVARLRRLHDTMNDITTNSDLSIELEVVRNDEIGSVSRAFNHMVAQINESMSKVAAQAAEVNAAASSITSMTETTGEQVMAQKLHTEQVASAMTEMAASAVQVKRDANQTTEQSHQAADAAINGEKQAQAAVSGIESLNSKVQSGAGQIQQLNQQTDEVASVLAVISSIAEQTNLLALNAAIEAARAGEQGRGFAVVADEVRSLASRTQESTDEIRNTIETLRSGASGCVDIMDEASTLAQQQVDSIMMVAKDLHGIADAVRGISQLNNQMELAATEQSQVAEAINSSVVEISQSAESTAVDAKETAKISEDMLRLASELQKVVAQFKLKA